MSAPNPRSLMMRTPEFAAALDVSKTTVKKMLADGTCPVAPRRVGKQWRWSRHEVEQWLRTRQDAS